MHVPYRIAGQDFVTSKIGYLKTQVGNPEGADKPNKKYYDPRVWVREGEKTLTARVKEACTDLGNVGTFISLSWMGLANSPPP